MNYSVAFIKVELKREIEDELKQNSNILSVSNFIIERTASGIIVSMEVNTVYDTGGNLITVAL